MSSTVAAVERDASFSELCINSLHRKSSLQLKEFFFDSESEDFGRKRLLCCRHGISDGVWFHWSTNWI